MVALRTRKKEWGREVVTLFVSGTTRVGHSFTAQVLPS